jgi:hypothetical protein
MAEEWADQVTETDAHTLVDKLQAFEAALSPAEQALLRAALRRVAGVSEDVHGHLLLDPFIRAFLPGADEDDRDE